MEERHPRFARDGAREKRLPRARRPDQKHTLWDARAERLELARVLQELDHLHQLGLRLLHARDVLESDLRTGFRAAAGAASPERHCLAAACLSLAHHEDPEEEQQEAGDQQVEEPAHPDVRDRGPLYLDLRADLRQRGRHVRLLIGRQVDDVLFPVGELARPYVLRRDGQRLHFAVLDLLHELAEDQGRLAFLLFHVLLQEHQGQHDQPNPSRYSEEARQEPSPLGLLR